MKLDYIEFYSGDAERKGTAVPTSMNTNIAIGKAEAKNSTLSIEFEYGVLYVPDQSYIRMKGRASFTGPEAQKSYAEWAKSKVITGPHGEYVFNAIYYHSTINALLISKSFGMMPPINLPTLKTGANPAAQKK